LDKEKLTNDEKRVEKESRKAMEVFGKYRGGNAKDGGT
jgi:hypothetical protein